jgi:hypothetical protein
MPARECLEPRRPKRYIITEEATMPTHIHDHHHHHHPGEGHPPASISPSILRLSAIERLAAASVVIVMIWAAVFWAMAGS